MLSPVRASNAAGRAALSAYSGGRVTCRRCPSQSSQNSCHAHGSHHGPMLYLSQAVPGSQLYFVQPWAHLLLPGRANGMHCSGGLHALSRCGGQVSLYTRFRSHAGINIELAPRRPGGRRGSRARWWPAAQTRCNRNMLGLSSRPGACKDGSVSSATNHAPAQRPLRLQH